MTGDFSKWYFDRKNNFNGVLHQQGRVLLDSDWNDQTRIINDWQNQAGRDIIGPGIAAIPASEPDALEVTKASVSGLYVKIWVNPGRGWVDGLAVCLRDISSVVATYLQDTEVSSIEDGIRDAVILEVWQEAVNGFQLHDMLIEPALGGPDTTERVHTGMALRLLRLEEGDTCDNIRDKLKDDFSIKGKLKVTLQPATGTDDVCPEVEKGGYTGFEHNLYRIEIAEVNDEIPTSFKWSQFNSGLVGLGTFNKGKVIITANLQAIITSGLSEFYLEALDNDPDLDHWKAIYGTNVTLNENNELDLNSLSIFGSIPTSEDPVFFRLWNEIREIGEFPIESEPEGEPQELYDGIRLEFDVPDGTNYKPGDYWTFPVRAGGIKNHEVLIYTQPPEGIHYHRVPLAILNWGIQNYIKSDRIEDCRHVFRPLTNQTVCCTYLVGDHGDFNTIEEALEHLPVSGGEICLLPGLHETNAVIEGKKNIRIRGCGEQTFVRPGQSNRERPIFHVVDSQQITIEHMVIATFGGTHTIGNIEGGTAIVLEKKSGNLQDVEISNNRIVAYEEGIHVKDGVDVKIHDNKIRMIDRKGAGVGIYMLAEDSIIERNDIVVFSAESIPPSFFPDGELNPTGPCPDLEAFHADINTFTAYTLASLNVIIDIPQPVQALGGIQIAGGSEKIKVLENVIKGGAGNGIILGNVPSVLPGSEVEENGQLIIDNKAYRIWCEVKDNQENFLVGINLRLTQTDEYVVLEDTTDFTGRIIFKNVSEGQYNVSITTPGYRIIELEIDKSKRIIKLLIYVEKVDIDTSNTPASLYEIQIDRNEISNMGLSGIGSSSSPIVRPAMNEKVAVQSKLGNLATNLSIYNNHIFNCLQTTDDLELRAEVTKKGVGGISLGMCEHLSIHRNRIENNGISHIYPVCGIYVADGEQVDITYNHISNNGPLMSDLGTSDPLENGIRGGIVLTASSFDNSDSITGENSFVSIGGHAARVHDNIVNQPAGQALRIMADGPVSILNNQFNSVLSGLNYQNISGSKKSFNFDKIAGAVLIYNSGKHFDISAPKKSADWQIPTVMLPDWQKSTIAMPAGNILFNSNQTRVGQINKSFFSQLIVSLDDIGFNGNQSDNFQNDSLLSNTLLVATTLRASESRFKEMIRSMKDQVLSLLTFAILGNITTSNQGNHCIIAESVFSIIKEPNQSLICNAELKNIGNISNAILYFLGEVYND